MRATRQCYAEIWKQGGQSSKTMLPKGGNGILTWEHSFQAQVSISALPCIDMPVCLEAPYIGILRQRWAASYRHTQEGSISVRGW